MHIQGNDLGLESALALDSYTIEITTTRTDYRLFENIVLLPIFHPDSDPLNDDILIGAGPYKLEIDNRPNSVSLIKNCFYWDTPNVMIDRIIFQKVASRYEAIDAINGLNPQYLDKNIILDPSWNLWDWRGDINAPYTISIDYGYQELAFNNINEYLDEGEERVNISRLIDRQGIINRHLKGLGTPAATAWHNDWFGYDPSILPWDVDPLGTPLIEDSLNDMTFLVPNSNPARVNWAEEIVETLNNNGYQINLVIASWGYIIPRTIGHPALFDGDPTTVVPTFEEGGYDGLFVGYGWGELPYLESAYGTGSADNFYNYNNPEFDTLWAEFVGTWDPAIASQIQQLIHENEPAAIILRPNDVMFYSDNIGGIPSSLAPLIFHDWTNLYIVGGPSDPNEEAIVKLNLLISITECIYETGYINKGELQSLQAKLYGAISKLETGGENQVNTAINKIQSFVNELNALVNSNILTLDQADPMIYISNKIIDCLS